MRQTHQPAISRATRTTVNWQPAPPTVKDGVGELAAGPLEQLLLAWRPRAREPRRLTG
jgi:hypothetical protein